MDNLSEAEDKRRKLILQIQKLYANGCAIKQIARLLGIDRRTIRKYMEGSPDILCKSSKLAVITGYKELILKCLESGMIQANICRVLRSNGYRGSDSNVRMYVKSLVREYDLSINKYKSSMVREQLKNNVSLLNKESRYITRRSIFKYLWMNGDLTISKKNYLYTKYPVIGILDKCIKEFRDAFNKKDSTVLYLFIENYKSCDIKELSSLASSLEKDLEAVENAVTSNLSSGFVEGTNSKIKMIKRTMYGRCGLKLLSAKLMYKHTSMPLNTEY